MKKYIGIRGALLVLGLCCLWLPLQANQHPHANHPPQLMAFPDEIIPNVTFHPTSVSKPHKSGKGLKQRAHPLSIVSYVLGGVAFTLAMLTTLGALVSSVTFLLALGIFYFPAALLTLIFGLLALRDLRRNPENEAGKKYAKRGILLALGAPILALVIIGLHLLVYYLTHN